MLKPMLACGKVYISESRNKVALESIERAAKLFPEVAVIIKFEDESYNRVRYTIVSKLTSPGQPIKQCPLKNAVLEMVRTALDTIDLKFHSRSHPRVGIVDHVCFHPLASTSLEDVAGTAKSLAADVGSSLPAHGEGRSLDSIRRELGYFRPNTKANLWAGGMILDTLLLKPDEGPNQAIQSKGVIVIGATRWVDNCNILVFSNDINVVRRIAKRVSSRGGGLPSVQSMALAHREGIIEVACNLLEPNRVNGIQVQLEVERLAKEECMFVGKGYYTNLPHERIVESYLKLV